MKKLFNFQEYQLFEEANIDKLLPKNLDLGMLDIVFSNVDLEKLLVNSAQIISIISSFFGKFGMRVSLTIESLLLLYWLWKYNNAKTALDKEDALVQLCFSAFGFVVLGATPAFKAVSRAFANGYKEFKATGEIAAHGTELKALLKNETALKNAVNKMDDVLEKNLDKLPEGVVSKATKEEIKETGKGVKKYADELFEAESKTGKKVKTKVKPKSSKLKKTGKLIKLGKKLFPIASYLLNRFLKKNEKPADHLSEVENDFAILKYQIGNEKIVGADFPEDLKYDKSVRENRNGTVVPTVIGIKILIQDFDNKKVIDNYNILTELDSDYQYYMVCAVNGEPIYNNFKLFALKDNHILISKLSNGNIEFVDPLEVIPKLKECRLISNEEADEITVKNFEKVLAAYRDNLKTTNSYTMWAKIVERTFTMQWWDKTFKMKEE